jgi:diguanylate cyclase (GGDEF)-like protein
LVRRPPSWRVVLPGADAIGFEVAMLILGVVTAGFLLSNPWFVPTVFVLMAILHRSTLVKELEVAASTDTKTGLLNAAAWQQLAERHLLRARRERSPAAVLMIDLDHFKHVNDTFGHQAGDVALRAVADCLKAELRGYDALGRFGGEEFVAVLDQAAPDAALAIAQRLTHAVRTLAPMLADFDSPLSITASIGVANYPADGTSIDALIRAADTALHTAKVAGRNRVHHTAG